MKRCSVCAMGNTDDARYCSSCGRPLFLENATRPEHTAWWRRLPSFAWILIGVGGIITLIGGIILGMWTLANVEGVASVGMLVLAVLIVRPVYARTPIRNPIAIAIGVGFFAVMGMAIDQPGNALYNAPIGWIECPPGTSLSRTVDVLHPTPGRTDMIQDFAIVDDATGNRTGSVSLFTVIGVRFAEYLLIGYALIGLRNLCAKLRTHSQS